MRFQGADLDIPDVVNIHGDVGCEGKRLMEQVFDCGKAGYVFHKLLHAFARLFNHSLRWTGDVRSQRELEVIDAGRLPRLH